MLQLRLRLRLRLLLRRSSQSNSILFDKNSLELIRLVLIVINTLDDVGRVKQFSGILDGVKCSKAFDKRLWWW